MNKERNHAKKIQRKSLKQARKRKTYTTHRNRGKGKGMKSKTMKALQYLIRSGKIKIVPKRDEGTHGVGEGHLPKVASSDADGS